MERQWSFTSKSTRLLLFSFTIPSSLLFFLLFPTWVLNFKSQDIAASISNFSTSGTRNTLLVEINHLEEDATPPEEALSPGREWKDEVLAGAHVSKSSDFYEEALEAIKGRKDAIFNQTHLGRVPVSSGEGLDLVDAHLKESTDFSEAMSNESYPKSSAAESARTCDVSLGRWVFDESYPLYTNNSCPFIDEGFSCEANGRRDRDYMKWRWQPHQCSIPRFNPKVMLELIRGKRLVFVGDSINRNQWESMLCLLRGAISDPGRLYEARHRKITKARGNYNFKFMDYHCSVEYYVSHFLVHESKARIGQKRVKTLRIDTMDRSSSRWRGADIIVFNTAHWWSHYKTKTGLNYYQEGDQVHPHLDASTAFRKALTTWASWVDRHATPGKTQVFFRSSAPSHFRGGEWNSGGHCMESTHPLNDTHPTTSPEKNLIVEEVVRQMRTPVTILNITSLSGLRIDGHPSIYGKKPGKGSPSSVQDCSHWCLPGVPDTWNELLYYYLVQTRRSNSAVYTRK